MADYTDDQIEQILKDAAAKAGVTYDQSDSQDVAHRDNSQAGLDAELKKYDYRSDNTPDSGDNNNGNPDPWDKTASKATPSMAPGNSTAGQWTTGGSTGGGADDILSQIRDQLLQRNTQDAARADTLYNNLEGQVNQSQNVDPNDPIIKGQVDAYRAEQVRNQRNYMNDLAEKAGPDANLAGEARMTNEKIGQNTASEQAQLMTNELTQRRAQISDALNSERSILTADQQASLEQQLAVLDNQIKQQQVNLGQASLSEDWQKALMSNSQFLDELGLNTADRASYWDAVRSGLI